MKTAYSMFHVVQLEDLRCDSFLEFTPHHHLYQSGLLRQGCSSSTHDYRSQRDVQQRQHQVEL